MMAKKGLKFAKDKFKEKQEKVVIILVLQTLFWAGRIVCESCGCSDPLNRDGLSQILPKL
jgi:hypothetical protein